MSPYTMRSIMGFPVVGISLPSYARNIPNGRLQSTQTVARAPQPLAASRGAMRMILPSHGSIPAPLRHRTPPDLDGIRLVAPQRPAREHLPPHQLRHPPPIPST